MSIRALRTPDDRFAGLPDWPYEPRYLDGEGGYEGLRMHYVDEGPTDAEHVFLCLHGEPTWAYLYRKMIPGLFEAGHRVVCPDWYGFGRSDKPVDDEVYTFDFHRGSLLAFIRRLELDRFVLVCQDWGGILGLTLPADEPDRLAGAWIMNTTLATGTVDPPPGFVAWRDFMAGQPDLNVGRLMLRAVPGLTEAEAAAYDAPFPDERYKAGVRRFPPLVPTSEDMEGAEVSRRAATWWTTSWSGPTFMAIGAQDPVLGPAVMEHLRSSIAGCPEPLMLKDAGHFVQEVGRPLVDAALPVLTGHQT